MPALEFSFLRGRKFLRARFGEQSLVIKVGVVREVWTHIVLFDSSNDLFFCIEKVFSKLLNFTLSGTLG